MYPSIVSCNPGAAARDLGHPGDFIIHVGEHADGKVRVHRKLCGDHITEMNRTSKSSTLQTLQRNCVGFRDIVRSLGYDRSFPISRDWHVSYHKGFYDSIPCYFMGWSGFEYVWILQ